MSDAYQIITQRIIQKLESRLVPWTRPWSHEVGMPKNLISNKEYRGINVFLLHCLGYNHRIS